MQIPESDMIFGDFNKDAKKPMDGRTKAAKARKISGGKADGG